MMATKSPGLDKKDDRPMRGKSPERDRKRGEPRYETNRMDPHSVRCRLFIGNLATEKMSRQELESIFIKYGHISGCSLHNNYGFVQFDTEKAADEAVAKEDGKLLFGKKLDVHLVADKKKKSGGPPPDIGRGRGGRRNSPPRDRNRADDFGRYPSRFDHPDSERYGRPLSPPRHAPFREPYDRPDDYHRDRYRDEHMRDPYDRRDHPPPPRGPYAERRDPYDYPPRGDPYHEDIRGDGARRDDFRHEGPRRDELRREDPRRDDPRRFDERRDDPRHDDPHRDIPRHDESRGHYDSYSRDYQDDYGPPAKKSRPEYDSPYSKPVQAPTDCVIILVNKILIDYGMMVERKFKDAGLVTDLQFLGMMSMAELLDNVTRHGVLYAVVVTNQHEVHRSVTVNILHGTPQEHRNMPLEDALRLVSQNFDQYMQDLRKRAGELDKDKSKEKEKDWERDREKEKEREREREREREKEKEREREKERAREQEKEKESEREREHEKSYSRSSSYGAPAPSKPTSQDGDEMKKLLSKAATGGQLSSDELSKLIENLSKQQKKVSESQGTTTSAGGMSSTPREPQPSSDAQSIAKQQADLQAKILSILNPGLTSVVQSASGTSSSNKPAAYGLSASKPSVPLFPAAKALSGTTSSGYNSGSASTARATSNPPGTQSVSGYGSAASSNQYVKPIASGQPSYGVSKSKPATPAWYNDSQKTTQPYTLTNPTATNQTASSSYENVSYSSSQSTSSYGVPKASPTSYGVPKVSANSYGVPKASPTSYGVPKQTSTSYGVPKASPVARGPSPASRGSFSNNRGHSPISRGGSASASQSAGPGATQYGPSPGRGGPSSGRGGPTSGRGGPTSGRGGPTSGRGGPTSGRGGPPPGRSSILGSAPVRGNPPSQHGNSASMGPPSGLTAVRGAPPNSMGSSFQHHGTAPRGHAPNQGGMHPMKGPQQSGGPQRFGVPAFRGRPPPRGAPISTVQGRGRPPPRPY